MASAVVDGDVIQVSFSGSCFGQRILLTRSLLVAEPSNDGLTYVEVMQSLLTKVCVTTGGLWLAKYLACLSESYSVEYARAQRVYPTRDVLVDIFPGGGGGREVTTTANVQAAITFRTDLAGQKEISTIKVGPISTVDSGNGLLANGLPALMATLATELRTPFVDAVSGLGVQPCIYHRDFGPGEPVVSVIRTAVVQPQTRVKVRRTVGRGE